MPKTTYTLSNQADIDITQIYDYSIRIFGIGQAKEYLNNLEKMIFRLCENPKIGKRRVELYPNLYSFPCQSHVIFYQTRSDYLKVLRILHESKDFQKHFDSNLNF